MSDRLTFHVKPSEAGARLDAVAAAHIPGMSRSRLRALIEEGHVRVNGEPAKPSRRLGPGDNVLVEAVAAPPLAAQPEEIPLSVLYRDADLAVIDKPAGLVVHPAPGHSGGTLANALAALFPALGDTAADERPGIVHRLDKDTSGLLVAALNPRAHASLQGQISSRSAGRRYLALATGHVAPDHGVIDVPVGRDRRDRKRMAAHGAAARSAQTAYRVLEYLPGFTLVEATLQTGRTHQIRVHFAALGHPLAGDKTYGGAAIEGLDRQFLHAHRLSLRSPSTGDELSFESPLPEDLATVLEGLRRQSR